LKFTKSRGQVSFFLLLIFAVFANCYAALTGTVTVTVTVASGHQTVKTRAAGVAEIVGTNTENSSDTIATNTYVPPYRNGSFTWPILWYFKIGLRQGTVTTVNHVQTINAHGDTTISKGGTAKSAAYGDRDSSYATGPDQ
jgi:hypothetical protein